MKTEILKTLVEEMAANGYLIQDLQPDGEYHRFSLPDGKGSPGYYLLKKTAAGYKAVYGDFVSDHRYFWTGDNGKPLSPEEAEKLKAGLADEAREFEAKLKRKHEKGAMAARFFWETGRDANSHPYLKEKKVKGYGLKVCDIGGYANWLMIPGYNAAGELCIVQYISRDGKKRFETGSQKKGAFYEIAGDDGKIIIAEGYSTAASIHEATGYTAVVAFDAGNLLPVAKAVRKKYGENAEIIMSADDDQFKPSIGNPGMEAATSAAIVIDGKVAIPEFNDHTTKPTDFNDLHKLQGLEAVQEQIETAKPIDKAEALQAEIKKMAGLDVLAQEIERNRLAEKYGIRKSAIDQYLARQLKENGDTKKVVDEVLPAEEPVDGEELLNGILTELSARVVLPEQAAETITVWVILTYCHEAYSILPLLGITSPVKRCGKTTLIEILQGLVNKGLAASSITPAATFRTIEKYSPTLLIDEADTFLKNNDELRGICNSGHTRASAFVIRVKGDDHEPVKFSTWAPKAIGMIGTLPDTIEDRSIVISLRRKLAAEKIIKTGLDFAEKSAGVRARCRRWADDHIEQLKAVRVTVPASGNDRADDNWSPLFAIAEVVGGRWPEKVKTAMAALVRAGDDEAIGSKLLGDIKGIFEAGNLDRIFSNDLVESLKNLSESPWADWSRGKGLTTNWLGRLLKPFGVKSKTMRIDEDRFKGYSLESFQDAFKRYIPRDSSVTPCQFNDFNNLGENQNVTQGNDVTDEKCDNQLNLFDCHVVTDESESIQRNKGIDLDKTEWEAGTI